MVHMDSPGTERYTLAMSEGTQRRLAAIVSADVVGYSRLMGEDAAGTLAALRRLRSELLAPMVDDHHGTVVKSMGDGWLVEFASVVDAVTWAIGVQERLAGNETIKLRFGVHLGDIMHEDEDIYGDGVNVAARLQEIAEPGALVISDIAWRSIDGKLSAAFTNLGEQILKNIAQPVTVFGWGMASLDKAVAMPLPDNPSIAVLPFDNMSGDPEQDYFADGISEDIITTLSRFHWLLVIARNSTFAFKNQSMDVRQISKDLAARYVLEGSIRKSANRVRVTAQLVDGVTGQHIWADKYDRQLDDIFDLQDELTARIAAAIEPRLFAAEGERAAQKKPENRDAWDLFLRARNCAHMGTKNSNEDGEAIAREALAMDPKSVGSLKILSWCLYHRVISGWTVKRGSDFQEALEMAERAVELDADDAEARQILGLIYLGYRRYDEALRELETAVDLNPSYAQGYVSLATCYTYLGDTNKSLPLIEKAIAISPRDLNLTFWRCTQALAYLISGNPERAVEGAKFSAKQKDYWGPSRWYWAASAALAGLSDEVEEARSEVLRLNPDFSIRNLHRAHPFKHAKDLNVLAAGLRKAGLPD